VHGSFLLEKALPIFSKKENKVVINRQRWMGCSLLGVLNLGIYWFSQFNGFLRFEFLIQKIIIKIKFK